MLHEGMVQVLRGANGSLRQRCSGDVLDSVSKKMSDEIPARSLRSSEKGASFSTPS